MRRSTTAQDTFVGDGFTFHPRREETAGASIVLEALTDEALATMREREVDTVSLATSWRDDGKGLGFLREFADQLSVLILNSGTVRDLSVVSSLSNLSQLRTPSVEGIDFTQLRRLRFATIRSTASLGNVGQSAALERLHLTAPIRDLAALCGLSSLRHLELSECGKLTSLTGIERLSLETLALRNLNRLETIAPLAGAPSLHSFEVLGCRNVRDLARIGECLALRNLSLIGPPLPSLNFAADLLSLDKLHLARTEIGAGDVSIAPLARLPRLRHLALHDIRNVIDHERIAEIVSLEELVVGHGPRIPTLAFLRPLARLRLLGIVKTPIVDRDFRALLELPSLESVRFDWNMKSDPSVEEINAQLAARRGDGSLPSALPTPYDGREFLPSAKREARLDEVCGPAIEIGLVAQRSAPRTHRAAQSFPPDGKREMSGSTPFPPTLLEESCWCFGNENVYDDQSAFLVQVDEREKEVTDDAEPSNWDPHAQAIGVPRLRVKFLGVDPEDESEHTEEEVTLSCIDGASFTNGELLFRLHNAVVERLRDADHCHLEGLKLVGTSTSGEPVYEMQQGS